MADDRSPTSISGMSSSSYPTTPDGPDDGIDKEEKGELKRSAKEELSEPIPDQPKVKSETSQTGEIAPIGMEKEEIDAAVRILGDVAIKEQICPGGSLFASSDEEPAPRKRTMQSLPVKTGRMSDADGVFDNERKGEQRRHIPKQKNGKPRYGCKRSDEI